MTVEPGPETPAPEKKKAAKAATPAPSVRIGATVIYTPSMSRANTLRSLRGIRDPKFAALVTNVRDGGNVDLTVFPHSGLAFFTEQNVPAGEGPNTFAVP
jgi:hypothetical protein